MVVHLRSNYKPFGGETGICFCLRIVDALKKILTIILHVTRSILSGVISNRLDLIRQGLSEGGNVNAVLDPFLG